MIDEKYLQYTQAGGQKAGSWTYDKDGRLTHVDGEPVPPEIEIYHQGFTPPEKEEEAEE